MSPGILVAGEAIVDLLVGDDPRHPVASPGGSPANTAVALARLGTPVSFAGRFGNDRFGDLLMSHLSGNGVDLGHAVEAAEPASLAVVTLDPDGLPAYGFHVEGTADWLWADGELPGALPAEVLAVHTGSLAIARQPGAEVLARWFEDQRRHRITSLDPNIRPDLTGDRTTYLRRLERLVAASDIVKVSAEDLAWVHPGEDPVRVATRWSRELGPALVVVTLGGDGATALHPGGTVRRPAARVSVVDTVGAGDAFSGGLLHWLAGHDRLDRDALARLTTSELARALDYAAAVAGLTCARPGADPPTARQVRSALRPAATPA
ncbi:carbohydrate kinase family protein [Amycolatopsis thermoflava]|uniref:carbohydrate kinase family protein n=1 Tax=Amycolatopsis thermoflava TaxID=84480 RepID=UPI00380CE35D